jgi:S-formylglutathione hydrolase FrmB
MSAMSVALRLPVPARLAAGPAALLIGAGLLSASGASAAVPAGAAATVPAATPAAAAWPVCVERTTPIRTALTEVSRAVDGRLVTVTLRSAAMQGEQQVNVLLPERANLSGRIRYPVLYLLHGAGGDFRTWMERDGVVAAVGGLPVIVVMPAGSDRDAIGNNRNGSYTDWFGLEAGTPGPVPAWESYHLGELVAFIDQQLPTRAGAAGRAIAGISMGGGGAVKYAAEYPGMFGYAGSFSGSLDREPDTGRNQNCVRGDPAQQEVVWRDNNPTDLAANLRGVRLFVRSGDGTPGPYDSPVPPTDPTERLAWRVRLGTEAVTYQMAQHFLAALGAAGIDGVDARLFPGSHSPAYWQRDLREFTGWLGGQLRHPPGTPPAFDTASAHAAFSAWGWRFQAHRAVREFAYLHVAGGDLTVTGSGRLDVVSPARYRPGRSYPVRIDGTVRRVRADRTGRLAFPVDLGPSHPRQQTEFGPDATSNWRTARVRIAPPTAPGRVG